MIVLTLARGSNTSFDLRGELVKTGVLDTAFRAVLPGVAGAGVESVIFYSENRKDHWLGK